MRRLIVVTAVVLLAGSPASAQFLEQFEESLWGVQASLTPEWRSAGLVRDIFGFEKFDLSGSDFTVGFARGRMRSGHWGLSFLRQEWREVSVCGDLECYGATGSVRLRGVTANWFVPFGSPFAGDRLQVGMHVDGGAGWFQGNVRVDEVFEGGLSLGREGTEVPAHELLPDGWQNVPLPLFRAEVAVAATVAPGLKVIARGGYGFPFRRRFGISVAYFPMAAFD